MQDRSTLEQDLVAIQRIDAVPRILQAVTQITGMRFAAVARVTETRWTACAVLDGLGFGLAPGGDLELETTICNEIRQHRQPVIFGEASNHPVYSKHRTPRHYGLESYASVPIFRANGEFFGTLCAIDSRAAELDPPGILKSLELFAELIGTQLEMVEDLDRARRHLQDARVREHALTSSEQEIRDLLQPLVTTLYLLQTSASLSEADRRLVDDMSASCDVLTRALRERLNDALTT
jgi:hypothetical protein